MTGTQIFLTVAVIAIGTALTRFLPFIIFRSDRPTPKYMQFLGRHLPPAVFYPFVRLGAKLFGHFDIDELSPVEAMKKAKVPVFFIHGDADNFVPFSMSEENYEACTARKVLVTIKGAGHGLCYPVGIEEYENALREFFADVK